MCDYYFCENLKDEFHCNGASDISVIGMLYYYYEWHAQRRAKEQVKKMKNKNN